MGRVFVDLRSAAAVGRPGQHLFAQPVARTLPQRVKRVQDGRGATVARVRHRTLAPPFPPRVPRRIRWVIGVSFDERGIPYMKTQQGDLSLLHDPVAQQLLGTDTGSTRLHVGGWQSTSRSNRLSLERYGAGLRHARRRPETQGPARRCPGGRDDRQRVEAISRPLVAWECPSRRGGRDRSGVRADDSTHSRRRGWAGVAGPTGGHLPADGADSSASDLGRPPRLRNPIPSALERAMELAQA